MADDRMSREQAERLNERNVRYAKLLGIRILSADPDKLVAELKVRNDLTGRPGFVQGGVLMSFADNIGAMATNLNLPDGYGTTTIESKTNFLRAVPEGQTVRGEVTPLHKGRSTQVWQTHIYTEDGKLAAVVVQTQMVLAPKT